jgi:hypothetical protein
VNSELQGPPLIGSIRGRTTASSDADPENANRHPGALVSSPETPASESRSGAWEWSRAIPAIRPVSVMMFPFSAHRVKYFRRVGTMLPPRQANHGVPSRQPGHLHGACTTRPGTGPRGHGLGHPPLDAAAGRSRPTSRREGESPTRRHGSRRFRHGGSAWKSRSPRREDADGVEMNKPRWCAGAGVGSWSASLLVDRLA